jgi:hypothetical protein
MVATHGGAIQGYEGSIEALPTRLSNMSGHNERHHRPPPHISEEEDEYDNGYKFGIPYAELQTQGHRSLTQAQATWWENGFKLEILEFQGCLQPEEFLVTEKIEKIDKKKVHREAAEIRSQSIEEEDEFIKEDCLID